MRAAQGWDEIIERHLERLRVERGLGNNSVQAYARDLREFQQHCRDLDEGKVLRR